jgi:4,5-DOPA dioxygenase extradiol
MYPQADVPVLPLSLPTQDPARLVAVGRALAPLRREGVVLLGSGNLVHNLRAMTPPRAPTASWAAEFDAWCADCLERKDVDALVGWQRRAPGARMAHPTAEHFTPILVVAGAGFGSGGAVTFPIRGFQASISARCVQVG